MEIEYQTKRQLEVIGDVPLEIECLDNLDQTIDQVFKYLEHHGNPQALEELCPYFGVIWPAARGLSEYLSSLPKDELKNKRILELGCGLALPSLLAAKCGARVIATDFHPEVPRFLKKNIEINQIDCLLYQSINWEKEALSCELFDWVVGSDILYERRYPEPLAKSIASYVASHGKVIIADPGRPYLQGFVDAMKAQDFQCRTLIYRVPHPPKEQEVFVLIFERNSY